MSAIVSNAAGEEATRNRFMGTSRVGVKDWRMSPRAQKTVAKYSRHSLFFPQSTPKVKKSKAKRATFSSKINRNYGLGKRRRGKK